MNPHETGSVVKYLWIKNIRFGLRERVVRHETDKGHRCRPLINIQAAVNAIKIMDQMSCGLPFLREFYELGIFGGFRDQEI